MLELKKQLLEICLERVEEKRKTAEARIKSLQSDLLSATKSSAGDKHETSRAMLHLEIEKEGQKLHGFQEMKQNLESIDFEKESARVVLGSIVETNIGLYFLSIGLGNITFNNTKAFAISSQSPIGKELLGKKEGDELIFKDRKIKINNIS